MLPIALKIIAIFAYLLAAALILRQLQTIASDSTTSNRASTPLFVAGIGVAAHILLAINRGLQNGQINYSVSAMAVTISALLVVLFLLFCLNLPIKRLGIIVYPAAALCLVFAQLWNSESYFIPAQGTAAAMHILLAMLAYAVLALATFQALLYVFQERQIKHKVTANKLGALPPLQTMETLLFRLLGVGVILLSLALLSGALFSQQIFGAPFAFNHHTVLAIAGWLAFTIVLYRRLQHGLRGSQAVLWIVGGFILIQLGYFGTKIVVESLALQ